MQPIHTQTIGTTQNQQQSCVQSLLLLHTFETPKKLHWNVSRNDAAIRILRKSNATTNNVPKP